MENISDTTREKLAAPQTFEELIEFAFIEGAGVTLEEVLEDPEFNATLESFENEKELFDDFDESTILSRVNTAGVHGSATRFSSVTKLKPYIKKLKMHETLYETDSFESALIEHLGDRLMTRAYENIPDDIKYALFGFKDMDEKQQLELLKELEKELAASNWSGAEIDEDENGHTTDYRSAMPAAHGSWPDGDVRPNCLGMATTLAALFHKTGVDSLFINRVISGDQDAWSRYGSFYLDLREQLNRTGVVWPDRSQKIVDQNIDMYNEVLHSVPLEQHHHSIAIRLADSWQQFDPYLRTQGFLGHTEDVDINRDYLSALKFIHPGSAITHSWRSEVVFDKTEGLLEATVAATEQTSEYADQISDECELNYDQLLDVVSEAANIIRENGHEQLFVEITDESLEDSMLSYFINQELPDGVVIQDNPSDRSKHLDQLKERCDKDVAYTARRVEDAVAYPLGVFAGFIHEEINVANTYIADPVVELANPRFMVGLMTLNHLISLREDEIVSFGEKVFQYTNSQIVAVDLLLQGEAVGEKLRNEVRSTLEVLPARLRHDYVDVLLFEPTKGGSNGKVDAKRRREADHRVQS